MKMAGITDIAKKLSQEYNVTIDSAKNIIVTVLDAVVDSAKEERTRCGQHVFYLGIKKERKGRNPKTGEDLIIPEKKFIKYKYLGFKKPETIPAKKKSTKK
jgi:nucleoid DNA-binding protein